MCPIPIEDKSRAQRARPEAGGLRRGGVPPLGTGRVTRLPEDALSASRAGPVRGVRARDGGGVRPPEGMVRHGKILIVGEDGVLARQMARTLRQAGHRPTLVSAVDAALREVEAQPDVILLDLEVPELPEAAVLDRLHRRPETAHIPVLAITGRHEAALRLREAGRVAAVLPKPVSGVRLREAVDRLVEPHGPLSPEAQRWERQRQGKLILLLLVNGSECRSHPAVLVPSGSCSVVSPGSRYGPLTRTTGGTPSRITAVSS